jgi:hypothetical protein
VNILNRKKFAGIVLFVGGVGISALSLVFDLIGIGPTPGFGWNQIVGAIVGVIIALVGILLMFIE